MKDSERLKIATLSKGDEIILVGKVKGVLMGNVNMEKCLLQRW